jgi:hypothetical protein
VAWAVFIAIGGFFGVASLFYGGVHWVEKSIDGAVERKLSDVVVLRKIAAQAQPMLIFDMNGGIVSDSGGLAYIEKVEIAARDGNSFPSKIIIHPKVLLPQAPLLSTIDNVMLEYGAGRGGGLDWEYSIRLYVVAPMKSDASGCRFRLEILR